VWTGIADDLPCDGATGKDKQGRQATSVDPGARGAA